MGRRGPKPLPTAIARARGYKKRKGKRLPGNEPKVRVGTPALPASVRNDAVALDCWNRLRKHLLKMKVLAPEDGVALEGLCVAYGRAQRADALVKQHGLIQQKFDGTFGANPAVAMSRNAWGEVRRFAQEFGLTPSSRNGVREAPNTIGEEEAGDDSPEEFLFAKSKIAGHIGTKV